MLNGIHCGAGLFAFWMIAILGLNAVMAQTSVTEFHNVLREKAAFNESDFAALREGQAIVRALPVSDKREVAVCGLVSLQVPDEVFLQSFRDSMTRKSNPAILEIGRFSDTPTPSDLQTLTIEDRDLEDLKECVVGDCKLKLSANMIERLNKEVNWDAPDYQIQATQLLKQMILDYVSDYLARGDDALIEYNDKSKPIRLAEEHRALMANSTYIHSIVPKFTQHLNSSRKSELSLVENAIVWSKIKFGLKPVIAINHIVIYKRDQETGPQVLITSKQIYANHYLDSSLGLTAFVRIAGESPESYLGYENRSRADGLDGLFGKMKRGIVKDKAVDSLRNILQSSKADFSAQALARTESASPANKQSSWRDWKVRRVHVVLCLLLITALVALFTVRRYRWKSTLGGGALH